MPKQAVTWRPIYLQLAFGRRRCVYPTLSRYVALALARHDSRLDFDFETGWEAMATKRRIDDFIVETHDTQTHTPNLLYDSKHIPHYNIYNTFIAAQVYF